MYTKQEQKEEIVTGVNLHVGREHFLGFAKVFHVQMAEND